MFLFIIIDLFIMLIFRILLIIVLFPMISFSMDDSRYVDPWEGEVSAQTVSKYTNSAVTTPTDNVPAWMTKSFGNAKDKGRTKQELSDFEKFLAACRALSPQSDKGAAVSAVWGVLDRAADGLGDLHGVTVSLKSPGSGSWHGSVGSPGRNRVSVSCPALGGELPSSSRLVSPDWSMGDDLK